MISRQNNEESISLSEFVMLLIILLLILIGFITSNPNPNYILESLIICIIGVIMFSIYLFIKKYAKRQTFDIRIDETNNSCYNQTVVPTIGIFTAIIPLNNLDDFEDYEDFDDNNHQLNHDLPPNYEQINQNFDRLPTYDEIIQNL